MKFAWIFLVALIPVAFAHAKLNPKTMGQFQKQYFNGATVFCHKPDKKGNVSYLKLNDCKSRMVLIEEGRSTCQGKGGVMSLALGKSCTPPAGS